MSGLNARQGHEMKESHSCLTKRRPALQTYLLATILAIISSLIGVLIWRFVTSDDELLSGNSRLQALGTVVMGSSTASSDFATASDSALRLNHIQVIGTHNSYHREISLAERDVFEQLMENPHNYYYSHGKWEDQLSHMGVRSLEIDLHSDIAGGLYAYPLIWKLSNLSNDSIPFHDPAMSKPGLKVFHVTDADTNSICHTFVECLSQLKVWSDARPQHLPITIDLELKADADFCDLGGVCTYEAWTLPRILNIDAEIRSVFPPNRLITPDDVRRSDMTLEQSILQQGWPSLEDSRGKFFFYFDNDPDDADPANIRRIYRANEHLSLQNRTVWTNSVEGESDAAFIKHNQPDVDEIQRLVRKGYIVRTRADVPIETVLARNTTMRELALNSGAQIVSTDFPQYGMSARWDFDYAVHLPGGVVARCNPVNSPDACSESLRGFSSLN